ncbi:hypothetical protein GCM10007242_15740 [Pigmentiphaga litoralis]|nr:hypothetical protein GCM10007242_15740 [Pigmentiphaga litoralis]
MGALVAQGEQVITDTEHGDFNAIGNDRRNLAIIEIGGGAHIEPFGGGVLENSADMVDSVIDQIGVASRVCTRDVSNTALLRLYFQPSPVRTTTSL